MSDIDPRALRDAFGSFLSGVTVVATTTPDGITHGFTANSFASVSLDPPLLLVCPARRLSSFAAFESCDAFSVSILAEGQEEVSNIFASYKGDRFSQVDWHGAVNGAPLIDGAAAHFACSTQQIIPAGDHVILIGHVLDFARSGRRGLGYAAGQYFSLGLEREASASAGARKTVVGAVIERDGAVLLDETPDGFEPPKITLSSGSRTRDALSAALAAEARPVTLGKAYSIFDDVRVGAQTIYFHAKAISAETGPKGRYAPIAELSALRFTSDAVHAMMTRYALEYETSAFNLYVGDERDGDIHS